MYCSLHCAGVAQLGRVRCTILSAAMLRHLPSPCNSDVNFHLFESGHQLIMWPLWELQQKLFVLLPIGLQLSYPSMRYCCDYDPVIGIMTPWPAEADFLKLLHIRNSAFFPHVCSAKSIVPNFSAYRGTMGQTSLTCQSY